MTIRDGLVVRICQGPSCAHLARGLEEAARRHIEAKGLADKIGIATEACFGRCSMAPNVLFERWRDGRRNDKAMVALMMNVPHPDMTIEHGVHADDLPLLIAAHYRAWLRDTRGAP